MAARPSSIDIDDANDQRLGAGPAQKNDGGLASPVATLQDLALSPASGDDDYNLPSVAKLIPLSMTDSASGERPLPSLHSPITYRDMSFVALYAVHLLVLLLATNSIRSTGEAQEEATQRSEIVSGLVARGTSASEPQNSDDTEDAADVGVALRSLCVVNVLLAAGWLLLFLFYSKLRFIQISCVFSVVGLSALAVAFFLLDNSEALFLGVLATAGVAMDLLWWIRSHHGLDFVSVLLELVVEILWAHPALAYATCGVLTVYTIWASWVCTTIGYISSDMSPWGLAVLYVVLHFYWTSNVFKNILTIVVSGTTMIWYYREESSELSPQIRENISDHDSPSDLADGSTAGNARMQPTLASRGSQDRKVMLHYVRCALSSSLGSVCIGSLLCPPAHLIWNLLRWARRDDSVLSRRFLVLRSERVANFIRTYHKYSFVHVAGYNKPFYVAAHDAWQLIEEHGVEAIVDDDLTSRILLLGANGWAGVMSALTVSALTGDSPHALFFALAAFALCYTTLSLATQTIGAVIKTLFVCFAENPGRLSQLDPLIYHRLVRLAELKSFRDHKAPPSTREV